MTIDYTRNDLQVTLNRNDLFSIFGSLKMLKIMEGNDQYIKEIETIIYERLEQQQQQERERLANEDITMKKMTENKNV